MSKYSVTKYKRRLVQLIPALSYFALAEKATAQSMCPQGWESLCNIRIENSNAVGLIIGFIVTIATIVCITFMIIGAMKWITSSGDQQKVERARSTIIAALAGLIISLLGYGAVAIIYGMFTGQDLGPFAIPRLVP